MVIDLVSTSVNNICFPECRKGLPTSLTILKLGQLFSYHQTILQCGRFPLYGSNFFNLLILTIQKKKSVLIINNIYVTIPKVWESYWKDNLLVRVPQKNIYYSPGNTQASKIRQYADLGMEDYMIIWIWEKGIWRENIYLTCFRPPPFP